MVLVACAREQSPRSDSISSKSPPSVVTRARTDSGTTGQPPAATTPSSASATACVSEGAWQSCSMEKRLTEAGFVLIKKGASPTGVFGVPGTAYALGAAELHVYLFPSAKEREVAIAGIDTVAVARRGSAASWPLAPTLITSNNLVAVLVSDNGRLIERVQNAITAGLPRASH
jgi:hypothetical protein